MSGVVPLDARELAQIGGPVHLAGGRLVVVGAEARGLAGQSQPLGGLAQLGGRRLELRGPLLHPPLQLAVELLELARLAPQLGEDLDLGAQDLRNHGHRHVVDGAGLIAAHPIQIGQVDGGYEDDRRLLVARVLPQHLGQLEAVELGHADIHQDDGDLVLEQDLERLARRVGLDEVLAELAEDHLVAEQLGGLIVDQQDVDSIRGDHRHARLQRWSHMRKAASSCSVLTGLAR